MTTSELTKVECISEFPRQYDRAIILVNGDVLRLEPSLDVRRHSPTGFSWGYLGSGPAQLALAILLQAGVPAGVAERLHHSFKEEFIAPLPQDEGWSFEVDVLQWVALKLAKEDS